jgi:hypothetical protein
VSLVRTREAARGCVPVWWAHIPCKFWLLPLILFVAISPARHAAAQAASESADENQQKARATLDAMVSALGGERWLSLTTTLQEGRTSAFYQGKPTGVIADYTELRQFPDRSRIEIGKKHNVVEMFVGNEGWEITYRGKKAIPDDQVQDFLRRRDHSVEAAVRIWMKDPKTILIYGGQNMVERHLADQVTLINSEDDSITIQMDAHTHLPLRRSWQWRDPLYKDKNTDAEEYDDYHPVEGFPTPFAITRFHNGDMITQRFLYHASYNVPVAPDSFDPDKAAAKIKK